MQVVRIDKGVPVSDMLTGAFSATNAAKKMYAEIEEKRLARIEEEQRFNGWKADEDKWADEKAKSELSSGEREVLSGIGSPLWLSTRVGSDERFYTVYPSGDGFGIGAIIVTVGTKKVAVPVGEGYEFHENNKQWNASAVELCYRHHLEDFLDPIISAAWPED